MRRRVVTGALIAIALAGFVVTAQKPAPPPPAPAQTQGPIFRSGAYYVSVDAYPKKDGKIVDDLKAEDFEIFEDGKPQKVENLKFYRIDPHTPDPMVHDPNTVAEALERVADPANRVFVVYLDTYHVTVSGSHDLRKPLVDMLDRILAPNDLFGVMVPTMRPRDISFGRKLTTTAGDLERNWPWGQRGSIMRSAEEDQLIGCFGNDRSSGQQVYVDDGGVRRWIGDVLRDRLREDATMTNIEELVEYLGNIREERKSVLTFTGGWVLFQPSPGLLASLVRDSGTPIGQSGGTLGIIRGVASGSQSACNNELQRLANIDDRLRMQNIIHRANQLNVTFYPVSPEGLVVFDTPISDAPVMMGPDQSSSVTSWEFGRTLGRTDAMKVLANNTDGIAVISNDLKGGLARITNELSAYYVLGYYSTNTKFDGRYRKIDVKLKPTGAKVTARRGYTAPSPAEVAARAAASEAAAAAPPRDTDRDAALNVLGHIRSSADVFGYGVTTAGERATLTFVAELSSAQLDSGHFEEGADVTATVTTSTGQAVGGGTAHVVPGLRGVAFSVPIGATAGPWRVRVSFKPPKGEVVEDSFAVSASAPGLLSEPLISRGGPSQRAQVQPAADFQFRRSERLHIEWMESSPLEQRQARLLDRAGNPLPIDVVLSERQVDSGTALVAEVSLAPLAPGDYLIEVTATSGATKVRKVVAIRVGS